MQEPSPSPSVIRFEGFEVNFEGGELRQNGVRIRLQEQPFQVLAILLERPGKAFTREELRKRLWPEDTFVDFDHGLNTAINRLREALGDSSTQPRFIETLPRRGYRFIAVVEKLDGAPATVGSPPTPTQREASTTLRGRRGSLVVFALAAVVAIGAYFAWQRLWPQTAVPGEKIMLAVLPFENLSGDPDQDYFSDGLTEEMIGQLGQLNPERLRVIARTSAMKYKATEKGIDEIGQELGVSHILEGSVRRAGHRVRITAQLIQVNDQTQLWAQNYDRELGGIIAVQNDVAQRIARSLALELLPAEKARLSVARPLNPRAHEAYLRGHYFLRQRGRERFFQKAIESFEQAIAEDSSYASAYAGLAYAYCAAIYWDEMPSAEAFPKAEAAAIRAVELDDTLAEAHFARALHHCTKDSVMIERELRRTLALNPNFADARRVYSGILAGKGQMAESWEELRRAHELDPLSLTINVVMGFRLFLERRFDEAIQQIHRTLELEPNFFLAHYDLGRVYVELSRYEEAVSEFEKARADAGEPPYVIATLGHCFGLMGRREDARRMLGDLETMSKKRHVSSLNIAWVYIGLGEHDLAFKWLEKAYAENGPWLVFLRTDPIYDPLRSDPRFHSLLRRMNFPE